MPKGIYSRQPSTPSPLTTLSPDQLRRAANLKDSIAELQYELDKIFGVVRLGRPVNGHRTMSQATRDKIAAAQRARWVKFHAAKDNA